LRRQLDSLWAINSADGLDVGARGTAISIKDWERRVLAVPGGSARVADIAAELRVAAGLTGLRERAGLSQRDLAKRIGVSQLTIAAIERSRNGTLGLLQQYVAAVGGALEVTVTMGDHKATLVDGRIRP
jgi:DNA-binding XRE family transcriptional regulator